MLYKHPNILKHSLRECHNLYQIYKEGDREIAILFQNLGEDEIVDAEIMLDKVYKGMELYGAEGVMEGNKIILHSVIHPFASVAVVLKK